MKNTSLRNKVLIWTGSVCLIAFALYAANPSFNDFLTSQFATTSSNKVAIRPGATVTNITANAFAGTPGLSVDDLSGLGIIFQVRDMTPTTQFWVDLDGTVHSRTSFQLLSATASTMAAFNAGKSLVSIPNAAGFLLNDGSGGIGFSTSPSGIDWPTNALASASAFPVAAGGTYFLTNMGGPLTFTGIGGSAAAQDRWGVALLQPNGADRTLTIPASWVVPDGVRTIIVTNGVLGVLSVNVFGNRWTNATYRPYY